MRNLVALTRAVGPALADCALTFVERRPIDFARAAEQHDAYCDALEGAGITVRRLPADASLPDAVFIEDAAVVLDDIAVLARPGLPARRLEVPAVAEALEEYRRTARIVAPGTLEGGDVLSVGRRIFVGLSSRSNQEGFEQLSAIVRPLGYETLQVPVRGCLHLKTAVTAVDEETVLVNPDWLDVERMQGMRRIAVADEEPFAANSLPLNGVVYLSSRWIRTRELLERHGFSTNSLEISELEKAEAGLTCLSLFFCRDAHRPARVTRS